MAASSSSSDWSQAVDRWKRVCDLGMEAALWEAGCLRQSIFDIISYVKIQECFLTEYLDYSLISTEGEIGTFFATLGRGITRVNEVHVYPVTVAENEWSAVISALSVNLSSNTNILRLCVRPVLGFGTMERITKILGAQVSMLGHALATNSSLLSLRLDGVDMGFEGVRCLFHGLHANKKLQGLSLHRCPLMGEGLRLVTEFLRNNTTLKELDLSNTNQPGSELEEHTSKPFLPTDWKELFFPALKENTTLTKLNLTACDGLAGEDVFAALLDLIQNSNTRLEEIDLSRTGLQFRSGQVHEELRINKEYRSQLKGQPQMATTSTSSSGLQLKSGQIYENLGINKEILEPRDPHTESIQQQGLLNLPLDSEFKMAESSSSSDWSETVGPQDPHTESVQQQGLLNLPLESEFKMAESSSSSDWSETVGPEDPHTESVQQQGLLNLPLESEFKMATSSSSSDSSQTDDHWIGREYQTGLGIQTVDPWIGRSLSIIDWSQAVDRWARVCDLGVEAALREAGCPEQSIVDIINVIENNNCFVMECIQSRLIYNQGLMIGAVFATLGRDLTRVNEVWLDPVGLEKKEWSTLMSALSVNLRSNINILRLHIWPFMNSLGTPSTKFCAEEVSMLGHALATNSSLLSLSLLCVDMGFEGVRCLFHGLKANQKLEVLSLENSSLLGEGLTLVAEFLRNNTTLKELDLTNTNEPGSKLEEHTSKSFLPTDWKELFFPALKQNTTLRVLILVGCDGLTGEDVFAALLDLIQNSNTGLEAIVLSGTGLEARSGQVHEELRINKEYRSQLKGQPQMATTSGRIVLCGYTFAGKTEISKTMKRIENNPLTSKLAHPFKIGWKRLMQRHPALQQILLGRDAYKEVTSRTRGFQVVTLHKQPYVKSIWDFAGQKEYYALHDYLFPDVKNSYFLYVCSCRCPPDCSNRSSLGKIKDEKSIKDECEYWMRFLASNSKPGGGSHGHQLSRVRFVLTKTDTLQSPQQIISIAKHVVCELKKVFKDVLDLQEEVEVINAHSSKDVQRLLRTSSDNLEEILADQKEHDVCQQVRDLLKSWSTEHPLKPILNLDKLYRLPGLRFGPHDWKIILAYLNDLGEIIFPRQIDFIVTNPSWFGIDVLGPLINSFEQADQQSCGLYHNQGFVKRQDMQKHLESSLKSMDVKMATKLIDLMIHLELCFENEPEQEDTSLFVPALFDDNDETAAKGQRSLEWKLEQSDVEHFGRRLECQDRSTTFLTPGFFPRFQVHLRNYIHKKGWTDNNFFEVGRNLIRFVENGVEVIVEYAGDIDDFIDILVRSSKPYAKALEFIEKHVVEVIRIFCASPEGCQGVVLVESVIRPVCVEDLHLCIARKPYSVRVSKLEDELAEDSDYKHTWRTKIPDAADHDWATHLLEGKGSHERIGKSLLLPEISSSMASGSGSLGELPKLFYTSIDDVGILRKLETSLNFTKVIAIKLHLLCDHKDGSHVVEGQLGRTVKLNVAAKGYDVPLAKVAITLLWAAVSVGSHQVGLHFPQIDSWVQRLFDVPNVCELSAFDGEMLHEMMNMNAGKPLRPVSKEDIVKALNRYWKVETQTEGLKEILKLADVTSFLKDFQLRKVEYIEPNHANKAGWVCDRHYWKGFRQKILRTVPH